MKLYLDMCIWKRPFDDQSDDRMTTTTYRTPHRTVELGFQALIEKLGCGGALAFIAQYEMGAGNYTVERKKILANFRLESLRKRKQ